MPDRLMLFASTTGYQLLDLITFYTTVGTELRAWTVPQGTHAPQAAGKIHSDMERGFIRAEVISFAEFIAAGSMATARENCLVCSKVVSGRFRGT